MQDLTPAQIAAQAADPTLHQIKGSTVGGPSQAADPRILGQALANAGAPGSMASIMASQLPGAFAAAAAPPGVTASQDLARLIPSMNALSPAITALTTAGNVVSLPAPQAQALTQVAQQFAQQPQMQYQAQVARAQVNRVTSSVDPQLEAIRRDLEHRGNQIQATSEHKRIEERDAFRRSVLGRLATVEQLQRRTRY
jgi:hypothetical protein